MKVLWTARAENDLANIFAYIATKDISAAIRMDKLLRESSMALEQFPFMGISGRSPNTREYLAHPHYWLIYRIKGEFVQILRVLHTSLQYP